MSTLPEPPRTHIAPADFAALALIAAIWGFNNFLAKIAVDAMPPLFVAGLRFSIALVALLPFLRLPKQGMGMLAAVAVMTGFIHQGIQYYGLSLAHDLSPMVIAMQLWIPASVGFAALWLKERAGPWRIAGMGAAFLGIAALAADPTVVSQLPALGLVALAATIYGGSAVLVRRAPPVHPLTYQAWIAVFAAPGLLIGSLLFETGQIERAQAAPWTVWAAIAFAAVGSSVFANAMMFRLVQKYAVARTTPFLFISPVIGVGLGVALLDDPITGQFLLGAALTLTGVALVALAERRGS